MPSFIDLIENQEVVKKLKDSGYGELVETLLTSSKVWTKKGRLNKSGACREMGWKAKQLEDALEDCRSLLRREFAD